jgi:hypothetical protein
LFFSHGIEKGRCDLEMRNDKGLGKTLLIYVGLAGILWLVRGWIMAGSFRTVILIPLGLALLGITGLIAGDWRKGFYGFLAWLLFEDMVRKYMGNNMAIYFTKDALVGVTYLSFLLASSREKRVTFHPLFVYPLGLFVGLGFVQVFNSDSPSFLYGILGMKLDFYYLPLMYLGYKLLRDEEGLRRFFVFNMWLAAIIAGVGIAQSIFGLTFLNPYGGADIDDLGHLVRQTHAGVLVSRPPSVFVSDGRFSSYVVLAFVIGLGAAGYMLLNARKGRKVVFSSLVLLGIAAMVSGSRGCVAWVAISFLIVSVALLWGAPPRRLETYRLFKAIRRSYMVVALGLFLMITIFPEVVGARWTFYEETMDPRSEYFEAADRSWDYPVANLMGAFQDPKWLIGHGIGTASLGVQYVSRLLGHPPLAIGVESGYGGMVIELGILGLILWLVWTLTFVYSALRTVLSVKGTSTFPVAISIFWFGFLLLFPMTFAGLAAYQNFVLNAYFWLLTGILFSLPKLNQQSAIQSGTVVGQR